MPLNQALLPEFDHEMATTRKVLERVPDDKLGWKPHDRSMTMGELATHLATISHWSEAIMGQDSFDVATAPPTPKLKSRQEILGAFDQSAATARKVIAGASDDKMMKTWSLVAGGKTVFSLPRVGVLRSFIMNHSIHHRGQLSVYLRLNNVPVPSIYGPSADEGAF
ncbi:MAG TPA: DinB family protein [Candidatus Angelobacter sp.]|nr:DinB family protein [Candidatus Angelobacter sp.]